MGKKLVDKKTGLEIKVGDEVTSFRGEKGILRGFRSAPPRVSIEIDGRPAFEFYPGVIGAEIVEDYSKKVGNVCMACWTDYTPFEREDDRDEEEQRKHPSTVEQRTILTCACTDADELRFDIRDFAEAK
jgi:hypothetical protein